MTSLRTLARPYADAIFLIAEKEGNHSQWLDGLKVLETAYRDRQFRLYLERPNQTDHERLDWLCQFEPVAQCAPLVALLGIILHHKRGAILPYLHNLMKEKVQHATNHLYVRIVSAHPISSERLAQLSRTLEKRHQKSITVDVALDAQLLAGFVLYYGTQVEDYSLRGQVNLLFKPSNEESHAA